jgi:hypothetical protein
VDSGLSSRGILVRVLVPLFRTVAALVTGSDLVLSAEVDQATEKPYTVEDGKVDKKDLQRLASLHRKLSRAGRSWQQVGDSASPPLLRASLRPT